MEKAVENNNVEDNEVNHRQMRSNIQVDDAKLPVWKKRRYHVVLMVFFGLCTLLNHRINLSVAIVAMTEKVNVTLSNGTVVEEQEFNWDSKQQGLILSSFFYGYIATQLLGGILASRFGGPLIYGIGIGATAVLTLLIPLAAKTHVALLFVIRILQGVFGGIVYPAILAIWANWAPTYERAFMGNIGYTGNYVGIITAMLLSGLISVAWGWEFIFYIFGSFGCLWYIVWIFVVKTSPEVDPFITEIEKKHILASLGDRGQVKKISHPWKNIFSSPAVWAVAVANFTASWGSFTLLTQLLLFLNDTISFNLSTTGVLAAIPYMAMVCVLFVSGFLADWVQVKGYLRTGQVRRYFTSCAFIIQMIFMLLTAFTNDPVQSVIFITVGVATGAFPWSGYAVNPLDLAPSHASIIYGLSNTLGNLSGIISPIISGYIVTDKSRDQWRIVFYICAGVFLFGAIFSLIFMRGKLQPWAKLDKEILENKKLAKDANISSENNRQ
ncbi:vesicular glutamate transporter 1-like [Lutzomyia longipalpis]|uniref:vesicular glutamate transporter 1-like n=1 Tax=Lutzomyia longipalpis TaxID=7200 RepID=UPI002483879F|nr:vesicular glutamate transporter 1-like [Lutzomyia longipalpis]